MSNEENKSDTKAETKGPKKSTIREYFESFVVTLVMAIFGMTFILQAVTVPTGSMQNTIFIGDYLLVNKFIFAPGGKPVPFLPQREIERGDIIVFKYPGFPDNTLKVRDEGGTPYQINFVKRVIGLPGDEIELRDNKVFVNGKELPEHRMRGELVNEESPLVATELAPRRPEDKWQAYYSPQALEGLTSESEFQFAGTGRPYKVPENHYFVMGDSRSHSLDSRYWGPVDRDLVVGRAMFVYWSCDRTASNGSFFGCLTHPRLDRIGKMIK